MRIYPDMMRVFYAWLWDAEQQNTVNTAWREYLGD